MKNIAFKYYPILILLLYVPVHLLEEAYGNFPVWMSLSYGLPVELNYPHWLINNSYFFLTLLTGLILFLRKGNLILGTGILLWSSINGIEHIVGTIILPGISPGLFSGLLFLVVSFLGFRRLYFDRKLNGRLVFLSFLSAVGYWVIPFILIVSTGKLWLALLY